MRSPLARIRGVADWVTETIRLQRELAISPDDLVLDIGSGHNPNPRANVLCDRSVGPDDERHGAAALVDRPFVLGDAANLPFKDKAFDFVLCSHLIEHVDDPAAVARELSRVARAGYIEAPSEPFERTFGFPFHKWFVRVDDGTLVMTPKPGPTNDPAVRTWFRKIMSDPSLGERFWRHRVRYGVLVKFRWQDTIPIRVDGPVGTWAVPSDASEDASAYPSAAGLARQLVQTAYDRLGRSLRRRSDARARDLSALLQCPRCAGPIRLEPTIGCATCGGCAARYLYDRGVPALLAERAQLGERPT